MTRESALIVVKVLHTAIWAFFVACILGAPMAAAQGNFRLPRWLAKHNKNIFTPIYLLGAAYAAFAYLRQGG